MQLLQLDVADVNNVCVLGPLTITVTTSRHSSHLKHRSFGVSIMA